MILLIPYIFVKRKNEKNFKGCFFRYRKK